MACRCESGEQKTTKRIIELYAKLEKFEKSDDFETGKIVQTFENFFTKPRTHSEKRLNRLYDSDVLEGTITEKHRGKGPLDESADERDIKGDSLLFRAMSIQAEEGTKKDNSDKIIKLIVDNCPEMICFSKTIEKYKGLTPLHVAILKGDQNLLNIMANGVSKITDKIRKEKLAKKIDNICAVGPVFQNTAMMAGTLLGVASLTFNKNIFRFVYDHFTSKLDSTNDMGDTIVHSLIKYAHQVKREIMDHPLDMLQYIMDLDFIEEKQEKTENTTYLDSIKEKPESTENTTILDSIKENPEKTENVISSDSTKKEPEKTKKNVHKLLMMKNKEKLNPLQLAAKRQQYDFFDYIMRHEVYRTKESSDGLSNEVEYDITEIETLALENDVTATEEEQIKPEYHESVLEYIVHSQTSDAFLFANFLPVREVIKEKWKYYRRWFWGWFAIHFIFMICLSVAAVYRSKLKQSASKSSEVEFEYLVTKNGYITAASVGGLIFGLLYSVFECARLRMSRFQFKTSSNWLKSRKRHLTTPYSNFIFRIYFGLFYLLLCVDFFIALVAGMSSIPNYHNNCLIFAVIIGWYLMMFFLQGFNTFSFFTVLIQRVIIDMIKFAFVMLIFLVAFSIAMFMIMQGASTEDDDFNDFGKTMIKMLTIMLGIGELGILFQARQPIMAIIVFVFFVCFTTILLLNALIAMMSNSCTELMTSTFKGRTAMKMHCRLQKLSVILFLESYLPRCLCKEVGSIKKKNRYEHNEWDPNTRRRFWSLSYLHEDKENETEDPSILDQHYINRGSKNEKKKKISKASISPDSKGTTEPVFQRHILDITDIDRKTCSVCQTNEYVHSQTQEMKEVPVVTDI